MIRTDGRQHGLIASGRLAEISWRLVFLLPVPVALLVLAAAPLVLPCGVWQAGAREGFDAAGAVAVTGGVWLLVFALAERSWPAGAVAVLLLGAFVTIERRRSFPSLNIAAVAGLPDERQGLASGLVTSAVQIGAGIGVAVLAAVTTLGESVLAGYRIAFVTAGGFSLTGALIAAYGLRSRRPVPVPTA